MNSHLLPSDAHWTDDKALIADLSRLNATVTRYVLRHLDVDAGRAEAIGVDDEHALGLQLTALGERLQRRASVRQSQMDAPIIQGDAAQPSALDSGRAPDMDNGP